LTRDWIASWAKAPGLYPDQVLNSWSWFIPWFFNLLSIFRLAVPLLAGTAGAALALGVLCFSQKLNARLKTPALLLPFAPLVAGLVFWFYTAPDLRFADWLFWLLAAWSSVFILHAVPPDRFLLYKKNMAKLALLATVLLPLVHLLTWSDLPKGFSPLPTPPTRMFTTESGLKVHIPVLDDVLAWDAPLPAAPLPKARLELRGKTLKSGFRTATGENAVPQTGPASTEQD
jgi:hypothetical protein